MTDTPKLISLIIPCYNEQDVIEETISRLRKLCKKLDSYIFELIFIDDGSRDLTWHLLNELTINDKNVRLISFSRNFGHQIAVTAGIDHANGDAVILMDADLQDPPEVISEMIAKWNDGYDVVYGTRISRAGESSFKVITAKIFYRFLNKLSNIEIPLDTGDFRLMDAKVVSTLNCMREKDRFIRGMVSWVGFNQISLPYERAERFAGESKYPLRKMVSFAIDGIISFSSKPLQFSMILGFSSAIISLAGVFYAIYMRLFTNTWVEGWTALMISILFIGGIQLLCIGILGEYIGRIYNQSKDRPLYIIKESNGPHSDRSLQKEPS